MDYSTIKDLIKTIEQSNLMDFELKVKGEFYIRMNKNGAEVNSAPAKKSIIKETICENPVQVTESPVSQNEVKPEPKEEVSEMTTIIPEEKVEVKEGSLIVAPMVGTFYASGSPDKPPYVKVGDKVKKGDVLCVVEAMKIMNEITSTVDGEIAEIMVENEDMVEYNQPLFRII